MYQQAPFNNEPSSGPMELKLFFRMLGAGKNILDNAMWAAGAVAEPMRYR